MLFDVANLRPHQQFGSLTFIYEHQPHHELAQSCYTQPHIHWCSMRTEMDHYVLELFWWGYSTLLEDMTFATLVVCSLAWGK